jgi:hypothetical protein
MMVTWDFEAGYISLL